MQRLRLDTLVTVLDCSSFLANYASRAPIMARPELGEGGNLRPVVDLLVEQLECVSAASHCFAGCPLSGHAGQCCSGVVWHLLVDSTEANVDQHAGVPTTCCSTRQTC